MTGTERSHRLPRSLPPALLALALASCGHGHGPARQLSGPDAPAALADAARLTEHSGCDETLLARDPESTVVLAVRLPGLLERAAGETLPYREELAIGSEAVEVFLERGTDLDYWCTDILDRPPRIEARWKGVSGKATVTLLERRQRDDRGQPHSRFRPIFAAVRLGPTVLALEGGEDQRAVLSAIEITGTLGVPGGG